MDRVGIPSDFYSFDSGKPFENCLICNKYLLSEGQKYIIERSIKKYPGTSASDVLYEYAICFDCAMKQKDSISAESLENIETYFRSNIELDKVKGSFSLESSNHKCAVHGISIDDMSEFVIQATCNGDKIDSNISPMVFGEKAIAEMEELISESTRDEMDDFIDKYFGGPPEWREILKKKTLLI